MHGSHIPDKVYDFCRSEKSVSSEYAKDPSKPPKHFTAELYDVESPSVIDQQAPHERKPATVEDLERAHACGHWGNAQPSELFLRIFHDALGPLKHDPLVGCVSPSLMGTSGVAPMTIIAPLPDIARHMSNLIARAEKEVFLATNYWMKSDASRLITDSLKELSRRAGERGQKVVVKIMYDRGNIKQFVNPHQEIAPKEYTTGAVALPSEEEVPHLHMQVVNYHRPMLGTFHSKYMVVDRRFAVLQSNNIQDNDNLEMMTHLEGTIVDSLWDCALISWHHALEPPLPMHDSPAASAPYPTHSEPTFQGIFGGNTEAAGVGHSVTSGTTAADLPEHLPGDPHYDPDIASEVKRMQSVLSPREGETHMNVVTRHLNKATHLDIAGTAEDCPPEQAMTPMIPHPVHEAFPMALVSRKPWGAPNHQCVFTPQNEAWLSAIRNAKSKILIQTPNLNASPLLPAIIEACKRGIVVTYWVCLGYNDAGEMLPMQGGTNEQVASKLYAQLADTPDASKNLRVGYYTAKDQTHPIHNKFKKRSCHIKVLIADDHIGIMGNGNQDTQSWYHSQEVNVMIDSQLVCGMWIDGLMRNQNTHKYGMAATEGEFAGCWLDEEGKQAEGAVGKDPGRFSWLKGVKGAIDRVRGAGGF